MYLLLELRSWTGLRTSGVSWPLAAWLLTEMSGSLRSFWHLLVTWENGHEKSWIAGGESRSYRKRMLPNYNERERRGLGILYWEWIVKDLQLTKRSRHVEKQALSGGILHGKKIKLRSPGNFLCISTVSHSYIWSSCKHKPQCRIIICIR